MYCKNKRKCIKFNTRRNKKTKTNKKTKRSNKTRKMRGSRRMRGSRLTRRSRLMRRSRQMRGGNGAPSPFVGSPYNAGSSGLPSGNYNPYNFNVIARPEPSNPLFEGSAVSHQLGGGKKNKYRNRQKGGDVGSFLSSLVPDDILNITRSVPAAVGHMYDKFNGVTSMPSTMVYPTEQPLIPDVAIDRMMRPPDISKMYNNNNNMISRL
jgi:hypothetical protein